MFKKATAIVAGIALAGGLALAGPSAAMAAASDGGWKTGCSSESPVAVQTRAAGGGYIRTYDKFGGNNKYKYYSGSNSTYLFHYSASYNLGEANWFVSAYSGGDIDQVNTYAYCAV